MRAAPAHNPTKEQGTMAKQNSTAELIAAINVAKLQLGMPAIKSVHSYKEGEATLAKLRAKLPQVATATPEAKAADAAVAVLAKASRTSKAVAKVAKAKAAKVVPAATGPKTTESLSATKKDTTGLTESQLRAACPAVFAKAPAAKLSERYRFVNTWDLVKPLIDEGFVVTQVQQKRPRPGMENTMETTRHLLRLRHTTAPMIVGEAFPELVLVNGHAGQTRFSMYAGIFRLICSNGMVIGNATDALNTRHTGNLAEIMAEAQRVIKSAQEKARTVEAWLKLQLNKSQRFDFAKAAMQLAFGSDSTFDPALLLAPRRELDKATDLWHVFNVVQENVMRGGIEYQTASQHRAQTRGFTNVHRGVEFNAALWETAEEFAA
jgi:hypothetical protein